MPFPFSPSSNVRIGVLFGGIFLALSAAFGLPFIYVHTAAATFQHRAPEQPIPFDHRHHAGTDRIDCLFCHWFAATSAMAGLPSTDVCWGCHRQIWTNSPLLAPVRVSFFEKKPIVWKRVYQLPDFVYFNHAIHLDKGVGCFSCHGQVDHMARIEQQPPLLMSWCLDCHRHPERHLRPRELVTSMTSELEEAEQRVLGTRLTQEYGVQQLTFCSTCHR